jgi:hypothetical protein
MKLLLYSELDDSQKEEVKRRYVHWKYDTTSLTFEDWANKHSFYIRKDGKLSNKHKHCEPDFYADSFKNNS